MIRATIIAGVLVALSCLLVSAQRQAPQRDYSRSAILAISPSYFECQHCESFHRHSQALKRRYPGVKVLEVKVDEDGARNLGITEFPTLIIGRRVVGYGTAQRQELKDIIERN